MGIAALILGILGIISMFLVFIAPLGLIAVIVGLILGIVDVVKKGKTGGNKGIGIAGIIICAISVVVLVFESLVVLLGLTFYTTKNNSSIVNSDVINSQTIITFNGTYETYKGQNTGSSVKMLLSIVSNNNMINEDKIITCTLDGTTGVPSALRNKIRSSNTYHVTLDYDIDGYVDEINIVTMES